MLRSDIIDLARPSQPSGLPNRPESRRQPKSPSWRLEEHVLPIAGGNSGTGRPLLVFLPDGYDAEPDRRFLSASWIWA
jgi:hypothetical protein